MLQDSFFRVDVVDRIYDTLVFEKTTAGSYTFTVPEEYNYIIIEYAGARGANSPTAGNAVPAGRGSILKTDRIATNGITILGVIGARGNGVNGGAGYQNGSNGAQSSSSRYGGGGGGSTSVQYNGIILEAGGGAGQAFYAGHSPAGDEYLRGGNGGGTYGGLYHITSGTNNARDPGQIGLNFNTGYVKIWAGYDPYF